MAKQQKHIPGAAKAGPLRRFPGAAAGLPSKAMSMAGGMSLAKIMAMMGAAAAEILARLNSLSASPRTNFQPGREAGSQTGREAGSQTGREAGSQTGREAGSQTGRGAGWRAGRLGAGGFSLVELLIIVSIIGILAFVAAPVYTGYKEETVKKELLKRSTTFFASATLCLMDSDSDLSGCDTKLKLGYYCPAGCEGPKAGKSNSSSTGNDTLSLQFTIEGVSGCVSHFTGVCHVDATGKPKTPLVHCPGTACATTGETCMPYKNFRAKGVCNKSGQASFPIKFCKKNGDCASGETCSTKDGKLDSSAGTCIDAP